MRFWISAGLAVAAALALLEWPYAYYQLLRLAVCAGTGFLAFAETKEEARAPWVWSLGGVAVLFNPFIPIHLDREAWIWLDLILALFLATYAWVLGTAPRLKNTPDASLGGGSSALAGKSDEISQRRTRQMPAAVQALAARCLASDEADTAVDGTSALATVAIKRLRQTSTHGHGLSEDDAELLDGLRTIIVTDAVTQVTGGDWELFAFETFLIQNAGKDFSGNPDDIADRIGLAFRRVLDLQLFLSRSSSSSDAIQVIGKSVMRWVLSGDEAHLAAAREAAYALGPDIRAFREAPAN